jgi:hypothetical protein
MQINPSLIRPRPIGPLPNPRPRPIRPTGHGHGGLISRPRELVDEIIEELSRRSLDFDELDELE